MPYLIGIDLTSTPNKLAAWLGIDQDLGSISRGFFREDVEVTALAEDYHSCLIAIDSPLGLPRGLCCLEEGCSCHPESVHKGRECERELARRGIPCYFTTKRSIIKQMVYRGIYLRQRLEEQGYKVIEIYPYASKVQLFGKPIPSKLSSGGLSFLHHHLTILIPGLSSHIAEFNHDLCDAAIAAYTAYLHYLGKTKLLGIGEEGLICIPEMRGC